MAGAARGMDLVLRSALPALFPALFLSRVILQAIPQRTGSVRFLPLFFALFCGAPIGAICAADLAKEGVITKEEARRDLFSCGLVGPSFLIGVVGAGLMQNKLIGVLLYGAQSVFAVVSFLVLHRKSDPFPLSRDRFSCDTPFSFSAAFAQSLTQSLAAFACVAGSIVLFSFFGALADAFLPLSGTGRAVLFLFLELTSGAKEASLLPGDSALFVLAAGCGWGSCSVHLQTLAVVQKARLSPAWYFAGRIAESAFLVLCMKIFACFL